MSILGKRHDQTTLSCAEWLFLAEAVHNAYRASGNHRDRVARDLLADNFRAFKAVIGLQKRQYGEGRDDQHDRYYMGNFGSYGEDIEACAEAAIAALPAFPSSVIAQEGSLNLYQVLVDQPVDVTTLHTHLAPYLETLLLVALRGYFVANETSLFDDLARPHGSTQLFYQRLPHFKNNHFEFTPFGFKRDLMARLHLNDFCCTLDLSSYVKVTEFVHLVWAAAQSDDEMGSVRIEPFRITWQARDHNEPRTYILNDERVQLTFSADKMRAFSDLLTEAVSDPDLRVHMERLAFVYGRI